MKYVTFLRGINVGGNSTVSMGELMKLLVSLGYSEVKTVLNSGNIIFESNEADDSKILRKLEENLETTFAFPIAVMLRRDSEIQSLIAVNPFKDIAVTPNIRCHITFLSEKQAGKAASSSVLVEDGFRVVRAFNREVCWLVDIASGKGTSDCMVILERQYGKRITTRTWNTVTKIGKLIT